VSRSRSGSSNGSGSYKQVATTWEEEPVLNSYNAIIQKPGHKEHIEEHITEMLAAVTEMEKKATQVFFHA
jgi:hypothetical protein